MIDIKKKKEKAETKTETKRRVNKDSLTAEEYRENADNRSNVFTLKHLKTDYAASEQRIKELEKGGIKTVPCKVTSEDDYYIFTYDARGLMPWESLSKMPKLAKYEFLLLAAELKGLTDYFSFTLNPENILMDSAMRPRIIDRNFAVESTVAEGSFINEYKAIIGATIDDSHSFEDYLMGGDDLYMQSDLLSNIYKARTVEEIAEILESAIRDERANIEKSYVQVKRGEYSRLKILLPLFAAFMLITLGIFSYEHFKVGRANERIINATELYFAEDYKAVSRELIKTNPEKLSDSSRYMAAISAVKSSGLTAEQKENILKAIDQYRTNKDYLNYWVCIGRSDYEEADQYAQKFRDNEHRIFALALRRSQVEKDSSISGSKKTEMVAKIDEEIKALMEAASEDKYGLSGSAGMSAELEAESGEEEASSADSAESAKETSSENTETETKTESAPKLLN